MNSGRSTPLRTATTASLNGRVRALELELERLKGDLRTLKGDIRTLTLQLIDMIRRLDEDEFALIQLAQKHKNKRRR